jgi:hypothetical protein
MPVTNKPQKGDREERRNTHSQNAGLEDAIAVLWEILDEVTRSLLYISSKAKRLGAILKILRSGPHAYKKDETYKWDEDEKD